MLDSLKAQSIAEKLLEIKTSDSQIRLLQDTWHSVYQNTYDEGLRF